MNINDQVVNDYWRALKPLEYQIEEMTDGWKRGEIEKNSVEEKTERMEDIPLDKSEIEDMIESYRNQKSINDLFEQELNWPINVYTKQGKSISISRRVMVGDREKDPTYIDPEELYERVLQAHLKKTEDGRMIIQTQEEYEKTKNDSDTKENVKSEEREGDLGDLFV